MKSAALANMMRLQALRATASRINSRYGLVTSYDPSKYAVKVNLQPEGVQTGFIPFAATWAGPGWGMYAPPTVGQKVAVVFIDGDVTAPYAESVIFDSHNAPAQVQSGEFWLLHQNGQSLKLTNDGAIAVNDGHGATFKLDGSGNIVSQSTQWTHTGPVHFTDNVQVDKTLTANTDVVGGGKSLKSHDHLPGTYVAGSTPVTGNSGSPV